LQLADAGAELAHQRRESDIDDGVVDDDDEQTDAQHGQGEPAPAIPAVSPRCQGGARIGGRGLRRVTPTGFVVGKILRNGPLVLFEFGCTGREDGLGGRPMVGGGLGVHVVHPSVTVSLSSPSP
jgi:hypothetical protein